MAFIKRLNYHHYHLASLMSPTTRSTQLHGSMQQTQGLSTCSLVSKPHIKVLDVNALSATCNISRLFLCNILNELFLSSRWLINELIVKKQIFSFPAHFNIDWCTGQQNNVYECLFTLSTSEVFYKLPIIFFTIVVFIKTCKLFGGEISICPESQQQAKEI